MGTVVARHPLRPRYGPATVLLHGAAGSWTTWTPVLRAARESGRDIPNPVVIDLPGWGDAGAAAPLTTIDDVVESVRQAVMSLGYPQWHVVGHSMGGFIAMHLAATLPARVRSVTLVSATSWSVRGSVEHPLRNFSRLPGFIMLWRVMQALAATRTIGPVRVVEALGLLRLAVSPLFRFPRRVPQSVIAALGSELRPASFTAAADLTRGYDIDGIWQAVGCPVVALKGDHDVFVRDDDLTNLTRVLPGAATWVIPECGHFANVEHPSVVLEAIGLASSADATS